MGRKVIPEEAFAAYQIAYKKLSPERQAMMPQYTSWEELSDATKELFFLMAFNRNYIVDEFDIDAALRREKEE